MKSPLVVLILFASPLFAAPPSLDETICEFSLLDPRLEWSAVNRVGELPAPPVGKLIPIDRTSTARQGGVWMQDDAGTLWMVKPDNYHDELTSSAEVISSLIYTHFGILTPKTVKIWIDGKAYAAVQSVGKRLDESLLLYMHNTKFKAMRFPAAYLKDWDRIHTGPNNFVIGESEFLSYDFGGTLGARAGGKHKPGEAFSSAIGAYSAEPFDKIYFGFRLTDPTDKNRLNREIPDIPLPSWHPWSQVDREDTVFALNGFNSLKDEDIVRYVKFAAYSDARDEDYMIRTLILNRDEFIKGLEKALHYGGAPVNAAGIVVYRLDSASGSAEVLLRKIAGGYGGYDWSFAKGRIDPGEIPSRAASREAKEELGISIAPARHLLDSIGDKTVTRFYVAQTESQNVDLAFTGPETEKIEWVSLDEAKSRLNKPRDQDVLNAFRRTVEPRRTSNGEP